MSATFFSQLKEFLPQYVSPVPSYIHSFIVFGVVMLVGHILTKTTDFVLDVNGDGEESDTEKTMKRFAYYGTAAIVGILAADLTYTVSWKLRNKVNRDHLTYSRWFPNLYNAVQR